jgi:hypothetical protein
MSITLSDDILSDEQNKIYLSLIDRLEEDNYSIMTGRPGSGQTLILAFILSKYPNALVIARNNFELNFIKRIITTKFNLNTSTIQFTTLTEFEAPSTIHNVALYVWYKICKPKQQFQTGIKVLSIPEY